MNARQLEKFSKYVQVGTPVKYNIGTSTVFYGFVLDPMPEDNGFDPEIIHAVVGTDDPKSTYRDVRAKHYISSMYFLINCEWLSLSMILGLLEGDPQVPPFEAALRDFGYKCYDLGKQRDWLLAATPEREACVSMVRTAFDEMKAEIASGEEAWRAEEKKRFELEERLQDLYLDGKISYEALWIALECTDAEVMDEGIALRAQARECKRLSTLTREQLEAEPQTYLVACELESRFGVPLSRTYLQRRIMGRFI